MIVDPTQVKYELTVKDVLDFKDIVCAVRGTMCVCDYVDCMNSGHSLRISPEACLKQH